MRERARERAREGARERTRERKEKEVSLQVEEALQVKVWKETEESVWVQAGVWGQLRVQV